MGSGTKSAGASLSSIAQYLATASMAPAVALTASAPQTLAQTWNNAGVTFISQSVDITDTASAAASLIWRARVGGSSVLSIDKNGRIRWGTGDTGISISGSNLFLHRTTATVGIIASTGLTQYDIAYLGWASGSTPSESNADVRLYRDAAATLALRNGTASQTANLYDTYTSATDYHRLAIKTARATLSGVTGATVTATGLIPDGAVLVGLTSKITTALGTGNSTTGFTIGTVADPDRWGVAAAVTLGTTTDNRDWTAGTIECFFAATDVVVTAVGGDFDGTGVIYLAAFYLTGQAD